MVGALVLAGGSSKRFGGKKSLEPPGSKPLLLRVVERALAFAGEVVVVVTNDDKPDDYRRILPPDIEITRDVVAGGGPMVGIFTGTRRMRSEYTAVLPCDSPFVDKDVFGLLLDKASKADASIPRWPNGYIEPLHAVYKVSSALRAAESAVGEGKLSIRDMIAKLGKVVYVSTDEIRKFDPELLTFFNINSRKDVKRADEILRGRAVPARRQSR
jgi:molybdopterin-guanine dinucleotide biosynthesis protein A